MDNLVPETAKSKVAKAIEDIMADLNEHRDMYPRAEDRVWRAYYCMSDDDDEGEDDPERAYLEMEGILSDWMDDIQNPNPLSPKPYVPSSVAHKLVDVIYDIRDP